MKAKILKLVSDILTTDKKMSLEYRLFFSAITVTIFITLLAVILGTILDLPMYLLITGYFLLAILLVMNYYMRYRKIIQPFIYIYVFIAILANAALWIFGGGLDSQNLMLLCITLILSLIIIPKKRWTIILVAYIALVLIQFYLQKSRPELITGYPSELARWIDGLTTTLYSIVFLFFIVQFLLKNYSFEKAKAERSESSLQNLNKNLEAIIEERTRELKLTNERLKLANEAGNSGAWEWDLVKDLFYCSEDFKKLYGLDLSVSHGILWMRKIHPDDFKMAEKMFRNARENKTQLVNEYRIIMPDNSIKWVRTVGKTIYDFEKPVRMTGISMDINDIKEREKELETKNQILRIAGETALFGVWTFELESKKLIWSQEVSRIHEVPEDYIPVIERDIEFFPTESREKIKKIFTNCCLNGIAFDEVVQVLTFKGNHIWVRFTAEAERDSSDKIIRIIGSFQNIDNIKKAEEELLKAKLEAEIANNAKSKFLLNISHEFRTPLNAVIGYAELIESAEGKNCKEYADSIKSNGRKLLDMVNNILELIRTEKTEIELEYDYVDIRRFFNEFEILFSGNIEEKHLKFNTIIDEDLPGLIFTDEKRLRLIVTNLIDNAIKFTQKGEVELKVYQNKNQTGNTDKINLFIEIKDTGTGIPEDHQKIIFEAFSQVGKKTITNGIGIGLSLTHLIISKMHGNIKVISQPGMGSRFIITLPDITFKKGSKRYHSLHENKSDIPNSIAVNKDEITDIKGLITDLEGSYHDIWIGFKAKQPLGEVKKFGLELMALGLKHNCILISDYGKRLAESIDSFNIDSMLTLLRKYSENLKILKT